MPGRRDPDDKGGVPLRDALREAIIKPDAAESGEGPIGSPAIEELRGAVESADDKERVVGLVAAPFAAAISLLVITHLIDDDPPALLRNGQLNKLHVSVPLYHDLLGVLLGMSVLMLVVAMLRKRLYLGILMALYGLAVFNLHYWGFGIPFLLGGAWLLVHAYRLQRDLREATAEGASDSGSKSRAGGATGSASRAQPNKRYTPPTSRPKRAAGPKPEKAPRTA